MTSLFINLFFLGIAYASAWFIVSLVLKRNDIADVAWGMGFAGLCLYLFFTESNNELSELIYGLVVFWGFRLSLHIGLRNRKKAEDFRYNNWRKEWGKSFFWRSYLQIYLLQVLLLLLISLPIIIASQATIFEWTIWTYIGTALWLIGFYWQAVGDYQLKEFKESKTENEQILQTGLWKYSRHPNYFGEICMWWGIWVITIPLENGVFGLIGPLLITYLLLYVSGVPMLEKRYKGNGAFKEYKKKTPTVFPFLKFLKEKKKSDKKYL